MNIRWLKKEFLKFGDVKIEKKAIHCSKSVILIDHEYEMGKKRILEIWWCWNWENKIVISKEFASVKNCSKYFVGHKNNEDVTPLRVLLPRMSGYINTFDEVKDHVFLGWRRKIVKYKKVWCEIKKIMRRKKFDGDPVFDDKYLKTKIQSYNKKSPQILKILKLIVLGHLKKDLSAFPYQQ